MALNLEHIKVLQNNCRISEKVQTACVCVAAHIKNACGMPGNRIE